MDLFSSSTRGKGTLKTKSCMAEKSVDDFRKEILANMGQVSSEEVEALNVVLSDLRTLTSECKAGRKALEYHNLLHAIVHLWAIGKAAGCDMERRFRDQQKKKLNRMRVSRGNNARRESMVVTPNSHQARWQRQ